MVNKGNGKNVLSFLHNQSNPAGAAMARRHAVTADELYETANRLKAEGKQVTATSLLDALGGGSLRTIYKYLDMWQEIQPVAKVSSSPVDVPEKVQASFIAAWRAATDAAAIEITAVKAKAAEDVEAALGKFQEALDAADKVTAKLDEAASEIEELKDNVQYLTGNNTQLIAESSSYKAKTEQLESQVQSQKEELERIYDAHRQEEERMRDRMAALEKRLDESQKRVSDLEKERDGATAKAEESRKQSEKAEAAAVSDRKERDEAIKEAAELKGQANALKEQNSNLMAKLNAEEKHDKKK